VALLGQHAQRGQTHDAGDALRSLDVIEKCIAVQAAMPRRESEVCARILYGLSTTGIALDLGVGEETIKTYRKRAYHRLGIGSERELLNWYLHLWSSRNRPHA
jgi:DNA-binding CsgD family transcriptional regulator